MKVEWHRILSFSAPELILGSLLLTRWPQESCLAILRTSVHICQNRHNNNCLRRDGKIKELLNTIYAGLLNWYPAKVAKCFNPSGTEGTSTQKDPQVTKRTSLTGPWLLPQMWRQKTFLELWPSPGFFINDEKEAETAQAGHASSWCWLRTRICDILKEESPQAST